MEYQPLDSLPYIDKEITDDQRSQIEQLILKELEPQDLNIMHAAVDAVYPTVPKLSTIADGIAEKEIYDEDFTLGGIDIRRYSDLEDDENLARALVYTGLRKDSLELNKSYGANSWILNNDSLDKFNGYVRADSEFKRQRISKINLERSQYQKANERVLQYLSERWTQGIKANVELGVQSLELIYNSQK